MSEPGVLRQNSGGQAEIVSLIRRFRDSLTVDPLAPLHRARATQPKKFERLVRNVEWKLIEMPLPRLQTLGTGEDRFVYEIGWNRTIRTSDVRTYQEGSGNFDNRILLKRGVGEYLVQLNGVLRPLLHRHWASLVARFNRLEEARLERFLFGTERVNLDPVRQPLLDLQKGKCFYCGRGLLKHAEVDHFIPWSRYPDDALDNLVVADRRCNGKKRDFLAAPVHLARWRKRMDDPAVVAVAGETNWYRDQTATLGVARTIYLRLPAAALVWIAGRDFEPAGSRAAQILA